MLKKLSLFAEEDCETGRFFPVKTRESNRAAGIGKIRQLCLYVGYFLEIRHSGGRHHQNLSGAAIDVDQSVSRGRRTD